MPENNHARLDPETHENLQHELLAVLQELEQDEAIARVAATGMTVAELRAWLEEQMQASSDAAPAASTRRPTPSL